MYPTIPDPKAMDAHPHHASIQIAIADDYPVLLAGVRQSLACDDIVVVAESTQMEDLLAQVTLKKPEMVLLGCEADVDKLPQQLHSVVERHADVKVILFTGNASLDYHEVALRNGARGLLLKHCAPSLIAKTVRMVSRGDLCFDRALTDRMLSTFIRRRPMELTPEVGKISSLTGRENQVVSRVCEGMRNKEIASQLYISDATVTTLHRSIASWVLPTVPSFCSMLTKTVSRFCELRLFESGLASGQFARRLSFGSPRTAPS
jgi:two-component system, NarL family, nitrate/nitrite response regulator NarL